MENVISEQLALEQAEALYEHYEIDPRDYGESSTRNSMEAARNRLVRAICKGRVSVNVESRDEMVIQILKNEIGEKDPITKLTYREVDARSKIGSTESDDNHSKMYNFLGNLSGAGLGTILKLRGVDLGVAETLGAIFLQV